MCSKLIRRDWPGTFEKENPEKLVKTRNISTAIRADPHHPR
jgi:hypothetical protein